MNDKKVLRCAVYTRKSTEEGLDQDFNSLQAQREACEAFIRSQRSEGWILLPAAYDDGGISGGTMERPALKRLLADIENWEVDIIVVYKVDRLTRSLSDFSKMVEVFDRQGVSFVAVTQQFNTTTSMGRLTLNVLLSFAQFEREVTGERIRDKIAASKRKGMFMGGNVPRGYRVQDRKLVIDPPQADIIRAIFARYLEVPGLRELKLELQRRGVTAMKGYEADEARPAISRGALHVILRNVAYIGMIRHKKAVYAGQHEGIIDRAVWDAVQAKLQASQQYKGEQRRSVVNPLKGKVFDAQGRSLVPSHSHKSGKRYRYYVSHADHTDDDSLQGEALPAWRLPARALEDRVTDIVKLMLADRAAIVAAARAASASAGQLEAILRLASDALPAEYLSWVGRVTLYADGISVQLNLPTNPALQLSHQVGMIMKRRGIEKRLVIAGPAATKGQPDPRVIKALRVGFQFWQNLMSESPMTAVEFAAANAVDNSFVGRALHLAFLAPHRVEQLVDEGKVDLPAEHLLKRFAMHAGWSTDR